MTVPDVKTGDPAADLLLAQCARIIAVHEHLRMDTDEDEALRLRVVETAKTALFDAASAFTTNDPKHRGPAYRRGEADGRLAAFADTADLTPVLANRTGLVDPAGELVGIARDMQEGTARDVVLRVAAAIRGERRAWR